MPFNKITPISVYSEFQPLRKMIVGRPYPSSYYDSIEDEDVKICLKTIAHETEEDCDNFSKLLQSYGVEVLRPELPPKLYLEDQGRVYKNTISDGYWRAAFPNAPLWPRDMIFALGTKVANLYTRNPGRWLEAQPFYSLLAKQFAQGAQWVSMPPPVLQEKSRSYIDYSENSILFHAACFLKCGKHVFHTLPSEKHPLGRGTELGLNWVQREFPEFEFVSFQNHGHIDGKIALLRPGLLLSWVPPENLPIKLQSWDIVRLKSQEPLPKEFLRLRRQRFYKSFILKWMNEWVGQVDETYFDVNIVSIDENTVILNSANEELVHELEKRGIDCIPFNFRHRHFWDGGLHCITQDLVRNGGMENYFE